MNEERNGNTPPVDLAQALRRAQTVLQRRPDMGLHDDAPATARWQGNTRVVALHDNGTELPTDMPSELGGTGDQVTPGWLFRAGLASCAATSIAMAAATAALALTTLEVRVTSRSDARGCLGMVGPDGSPVYAGPSDMQLHVRVAARDATPEQIRALVETGYRCSPIPNAVINVSPVELRIDVISG